MRRVHLRMYVQYVGAERHMHSRWNAASRGGCKDALVLMHKSDEFIMEPTANPRPC